MQVLEVINRLELTITSEPPTNNGRMNWCLDINKRDVKTYSTDYNRKAENNFVTTEFKRMT
ncbi:hypothetical protein Bhyg_15664 [Pseudolycoriella hygida]|uniref:Uncharacterized protein n=1 Tax=Pseudolycoriella hygida TaxID=35572 RepID=A0A9Q0RVF9_9DIPT|nr:hypothetical protein Bhyg_15664 [Pseudolycoriella hygida]